MKHLYKSFFLFILAVNLFSCKEEVQTLPYMGYDYFPDSTGHYVIYLVDSIWTDDAFNRKDTFLFKLKERIESKFIDNEGRWSQRLERFKTDTNLDFVFSDISDVWFATRTATRAEKVEENVRYVKLIFPVQNDEQWNGNAFNTEEDYGIDYKLMNVHEPFTVPVTNIHFDSTVTVLQIDRKAILGLNLYAKEVYALNVGLVYKEFFSVDKQYDSVANDTLHYGPEYKYYYMESGYE